MALTNLYTLINLMMMLMSLFIKITSLDYVVAKNLRSACSKRRATAAFRFKHGNSTPFVTIRLGKAELGSARLLSTAGLAVPHGSRTTWFQTACYCRAELNS